MLAGTNKSAQVPQKPISGFLDIGLAEFSQKKKNGQKHQTEHRPRQPERAGDCLAQELSNQQDGEALCLGLERVMQQAFIAATHHGTALAGSEFQL